jgi:hypothetical protein
MAVSAVAIGVVNADRATATSLGPGSDNAAQLVVIGDGGVTADLVPLRVDRMIPGSTVVERFRLRLTGDATGRPAVVLGHLRDLERGCIHPETAAGDTSCGPGDDQGELSGQLLAGLVAEPANNPTACDETSPTLPTAALAALADTTLTSPRVDASDPDTCLTLTLTLPMSADNLVQSDAVAFDAGVGLVREHVINDSLMRGVTSGGARTQMLPADGSADRLTTSGHSLPFTGLAILTLILLGLGLIQLAMAALALGRRRTQVAALRS